MITIFINQINSFTRQSLKNETGRLLMLSVVFSSLMLLVRIFVTHSFYYIFLEWNLFLAFVPYLISNLLAQKSAWRKKWFMLAPLSIAWILFIPNSFYILTDLFHLGENGFAPLWYDLLLLLSFAWNGLLMGILSVRQMEKIFHERFSLKNEFIFLYPVMWLNALGVYIGRYLRFNSWDIITSPFTLLMDILNLLLHPLEHKNAFAMVLTYSVFMTLVYLTLKKMARGLPKAIE